MVTPPSGAPPRRRGRPRSFDVDEVTTRALMLMWERGYEATSIEDLVEETGLSPSSLYAAFGSKRGVLEAALARYEQYMERALAVLESGDRGVDDVLAFLRRIAPALRGTAAPAGCFMVNTMTEVAPRDPEIARRTDHYRGRILSG